MNKQMKARAREEAERIFPPRPDNPLITFGMDMYLRDKRDAFTYGFARGYELGREGAFRFALHLIEAHGVPEGVQAIRAHASHSQENGAELLGKDEK